MPPAKSKPLKTAVDVLVEELRNDLATGALAPGDRIDQDELADRIGVSRTPVRLALERLEAEGLVKVLPQRGAQVRELTGFEVEDLLATRLVLEATLGRAGAINLNEDHLRTLAKVVEEIASLKLPADHAKLVEPAHRFNMCLYGAANSQKMVDFAIQVVDQTHVLLNRIWYANRRIAQITQAYFDALYRACVAHDGSRVERLIRDQRIDTAGVVLQDQVRVDDLKVFPAFLSATELDRLRRIIDDGEEPQGPSKRDVAVKTRRR